MARYIYCFNCHEDARVLDEEDRNYGWAERRLFGRARCPADHGTSITRNGETIFAPLSGLECDQCGNVIIDLCPVVAVTQWRHVEEPPSWESGYMDLLPSEEEFQRIGQRIKAVNNRLHDWEDEDIPF